MLASTAAYAYLLPQGIRDFVIAIGDIVKAEALNPDKKTLNVEYLSGERTNNYMTGPLKLPLKGFDL